MALSSYQAPTLIEESSLTGWRVFGSGGFGQIYKARHRQWCCDVAVKLLHYDDGTSASLLREIDMMRRGSSPYVIQVRGVFKGRVSSGCSSAQLGLVMEFMERGSLFSLQETLCGAPPWPLVFRLAHQVALGINFLHSLTPPLLHMDLKPSNVLLDCHLNAKLTDFGLARFSHSVTRRVSKRDGESEGGTISYMPPEAFHVSYSPTRASDIYSYGILLWSIVTGKQPYANAKSSLVRLRIPEGDRPSLDEIWSQAAGRAGLTRLTELMQRCWAARANQRPAAHDCATETEELNKLHKHAINDAVHQVLKRLDQREEERMTEQVERVHITQAAVSERVKEVNVCENVETGRPPIQEIAGGWTANQRDKARVKDVHSPQLSRACYDNTSRPAADYKVKKSSVCPIRSSPPPPASAGRSAHGRTAKPPHHALRQNLSSQYHRQFSSPDSFPCHPPHGVHIHASKVTGLQVGCNNSMDIQIIDSSDRKRHPTAPP